MRIGMKVSTSGPVFSGEANRLLEKAAQEAVQELVEMGEQRLDEKLRPRPAGVFLSVQQAQRGKASTGNYRRNVHGMVKRLIGTITDGGVVYGPWLEGISRRNQTTRFKGYAQFRKTRDFLQGKSRKVLEKHIRRFVRRMQRGI